MMDEGGTLDDDAVLWRAFQRLLEQYNPSDRCLASLCMNMVCRIFARHEMDREEFLRQSGICYDLHYAKVMGGKK